MKTFLLVLLTAIVLTQPTEDLVADPPGMKNSSKMYSGYLDTLSPTRKLHYVLVESQGNPQTDPLVLWLNGGPGCSSLLGFLQEIGSFIVGNKYANGTQLNRNQFSWSKTANILYFESPAGVGFSTNTDENYSHNDTSTADDAYAALKFFLQGKGSKWVNNSFFITGQSYAGKYIPDLTSKILDSNGEFYINIKGILVGNGVMSFEDHELEKSSMEYMATHSFLSPPIAEIYAQSCLKDFWSPRCNFFKMEFNSARRYLNHYNVYEVCKSQTSEASTLINRLEQVSGQLESDSPTLRSVGEIEDCPSEDGIIDYLNINRGAFNIKENITWTPCANINYDITTAGSIPQYKRILSSGIAGRVKLWLYNGDSDDVVPFTDTLKNLPKLNMIQIGAWTPWMVGQEHAGFYMYYSGLMVATVKGAGHMVPQNKRPAAYQMFYNFVHDRNINDPVPN